MYFNVIKWSKAGIEWRLKVTEGQGYYETSERERKRIRRPSAAYHYNIHIIFEMSSRENIGLHYISTLYGMCVCVCVARSMVNQNYCTKR